MSNYNFNTSDYAIFSVGEVQEALFATERIPTGGALKVRTKKDAIKGAAWGAKNQIQKGIGVIKPHVRRTASGGLAMVKGGFRSSKRFATKRGGQAIGLAKRNPRIAAGLAVGGGAIAVATKNRKKRRR